MTFQQYRDRYGLSVINKNYVISPGISMILSPTGKVTKTRTRDVLIVNGPYTQYLYLIYIEEEAVQQEHAILTTGNALKDLLAMPNDIRENTLTFLNTFLKEWAVPIQYEYNSSHIILREQKTNNWSFNLSYAYRTPGFNTLEGSLRADPQSWQRRHTQREQSNTLEGKFDPDYLVPDEKDLGALKSVLESTL